MARCRSRGRSCRKGTTFACRSGRPTEARGALRLAIELADRVGAARIAREARAELALAGGRPPSRPDPTELTAASRRVVELAASGLTNRQIANQLFVSVKNVEWHLANAYRRLGITGRRELAAALERVEGVLEDREVPLADDGLNLTELLRHPCRERRLEMLVPDVGERRESEREGAGRGERVVGGEIGHGISLSPRFPG